MELSLAQTEEPYRRRLETKVLDCDPFRDKWAVELEETIFYPEGGGQPGDRGTIGDVDVVDVQRSDSGRIMHLVEVEMEPGEVEIALDWSRRFDHMQQHTAQHLISAIAEDEFGLETLSFQLGSEDATIDLDAESVDDEQLGELQARVNAEIREARPVDFRFVEPSEYGDMSIRSDGPPDALTGDIRIVEIDGLDRDACGGTHVRNTAELQSIVLTEAEQTRGRTRLHYLAGGRVLDRLEGCLEHEKQLNRKLSCGPEEHVAAVESILDESQRFEQLARNYRDELADLLGRQLADTSDPVAETHRDHPDFGFLNSIARAAKKRDSDQIVFLTAADPGVVDEGIFLISGPTDLVDELGPEVAEMLGGSGGGPPRYYQGKADALSRRDEVVETLRKRLE